MINIFFFNYKKYYMWQVLFSQDSLAYAFVIWHIDLILTTIYVIGNMIGNMIGNVIGNMIGNMRFDSNILLLITKILTS